MPGPMFRGPKPPPPRGCCGCGGCLTFILGAISFVIALIMMI